MRQNFRDALTHLGLATSVFGLWKTGTFSGWAFWVIFIAIWVLLISGIVEVFIPKVLD